MSHLCFISTPAALRLSTSAPGNNYLARAHPLTSWLETRSARPGLCLLSAPSRQWTAPPSSLGCLSGARVTHSERVGGSSRLGQRPPKGGLPSRAHHPWGGWRRKGEGEEGKKTTRWGGERTGQDWWGRRGEGEGAEGRWGDAQAPRVGSLNELRQVCWTSLDPRGFTSLGSSQ